MLTPEEAKQFYNQFGIKQDEQMHYEGPALQELLKYGKFDESQNIFEFGCGTGHFAKMLLSNLSETVYYLGCDISSTMVGLSQQRLSEFGDRIQINLTNGSTNLAVPSQKFDRFICNYVIDLLPQIEIMNLMNEAHRVLKPKGLLCLISITKGNSFYSKLFMGGWRLIHLLKPRLVGGCRPLSIQEYIAAESWNLSHHTIIEASGIPSEVVIAQKH